MTSKKRDRTENRSFDEIDRRQRTSVEDEGTSRIDSRHHSCRRSIGGLRVVSHLCFVLGSLPFSHAWVSSDLYPTSRLNRHVYPSAEAMRRRGVCRSVRLLDSTSPSNLTSAGTKDMTSILDAVEASEEDIPIPTENGGYSHTTASKAKISAANKGKTPWNKGRTRSEEVRAKIAAGVRQRNREKFLKELEEKGITEEEYNLQNEREAAKKRARRTEKGGFRPTKETREKISKVLKAKHAAGEVKPRAANSTYVRKGFTHSEETRRKISESLKSRWANDKEYRDRMTKSKPVTDDAMRQRISESLKKKWKDPEFRTTMLDKLRDKGDREERRKKISEAIKAKWQTEEYRANFRKGLAKRAKTAPKTAPRKPVVRKQEQPVVRKSATPKRPKSRVVPTKIVPLTPITVAKVVTPKTSVNGSDPVSAPVNAPVTVEVSTTVEPNTVETNIAEVAKPNAATATRAPRTKKKAGDVDLMREKRRDLYDLLFDDSGMDDEEDSSLDDFDPYGLGDG